MKLDLHNHTWYSWDSVISPREFIGRSKKKGVVLAITEHGNSDSIQALKSESKRQNWPFIWGQEQRVYWGNEFAGELIGLFLYAPLQKRNVLDVIDEIHSQGGLVVVPHPFDVRKTISGSAFTGLEKIVSKIDLVEVFNSRVRRPGHNLAAQEFALKWKKPVCVGTDSHLPWEISNCQLELDCDEINDCQRQLLKSNPLNPSDWHRTNPVNFLASQLFKITLLRGLYVKDKTLIAPKH